MLNLNLLPPEDKKNIRFEEWRRLIIFVFSVLSLALLFFIVALLPVYFRVTFEKGSVLDELKKSETSERSREIKSVETEVAVLNKLFKETANKNKPNQQVSKLIDGFISDSDNNVFFSSISYRKSQEIAIFGFAPTRQGLIAFEKKIRGYESLKDVSSPVSNIIKEANINFSIRAVPTF